MDDATVRIVLTAVAENNPSQIQLGEPAAVVARIKQKIWIVGGDKGREPEHHPEMEAAARAAEQAFALFRRSDVDGARRLALEALKMFTG